MRRSIQTTIGLRHRPISRVKGVTARLIWENSIFLSNIEDILWQMRTAQNSIKERSIQWAVRLSWLENAYSHPFIRLT